MLSGGAPCSSKTPDKAKQATPPQDRETPEPSGWPNCKARRQIQTKHPAHCWEGLLPTCSCSPAIRPGRPQEEDWDSLGSARMGPTPP